MTESAPSPQSLAVYDHVEPTTTAHTQGIYRVVGVDEETVTLLRVADADGRRVSTGEVTTVDAKALAGFTTARNPDGNRPLGARVTSQIEMIYWSVRAFARQMAANPGRAAVGVLLLLAGAAGDRVVHLPDAVFGAFVVLGALWVALVGSGRS